MKRRVAAWIAVFGGALALGLAGNGLTDANPKVDPAPVPSSEWLAANIKAFAPQLQHQFCCNSSLSQEQRIKAAEMLAQLEYYPAIPDIMERIAERRENPENLPGELDYAYSRAMGIYGAGALPEIVEMLEKNAAVHFQDGGEDSRNSALAEIIVEARLKTVVLGILRGRFAGTMDRDRQLELRSAIRFVSKLTETDDAPAS